MSNAAYGEPWTQHDQQGIRDAVGAVLYCQDDGWDKFFPSTDMERRIVTCVNFCRHLTDEQIDGKALRLRAEMEIDFQTGKGSIDRFAVLEEAPDAG